MRRDSSSVSPRLCSVLRINKHRPGGGTTTARIRPILPRRRPNAIRGLSLQLISPSPEPPGSDTSSRVLAQISVPLRKLFF
jgi:hypothetical protein